MKKVLLLLCTMFFAYGTAVADDRAVANANYPELAYLMSGYTFYYKSDGGWKYHIKYSSIQPFQDKMRGWVIWEFAKPEVTDRNTCALRMKMEADCYGETLYTIEAESFDTSGKSLVVDNQHIRHEVSNNDNAFNATFRELCSKNSARR